MLNLNGEWELYFCEDSAYSGDIESFRTMQKIKGTVPGNFELDFDRAGLLPKDLFYAQNILEVRQYENLHLFYFRRFDSDVKRGDLVFEGIDTFAEIYLNGVFIHKCQSMLVAQVIKNIELKERENTLLVHILPTVLEGKKRKVPEYCFFQEQCYDGAYVRKAAHTYGWDIMPRVVSGGIWKEVYILPHKDKKIDGYFYTCSITKDLAKLVFTVECCLPESGDAECHIYGKCKDSFFEGKAAVKNGRAEVVINLEKPLLWWPRGYGEANLYDLRIDLTVQGTLKDSIKDSIGIRTVKLIRTSCSEFQKGAFYFEINDQRVYMCGTNWVPMDAFHSRDKERIPQAFELLLECNSNSVRLWGGNVYEDESFFQLCDRNGVMVWFDFSMACALYPQDAYFRGLIENEVEAVVRKFRNHACIVIWAGDNECDINTLHVKKDPNQMPVTRETIPKVLERLDGTRPYLPSSPYMDETVVSEKKCPSEDHNWGNRINFRGESFINNQAKFLSEIGFGGMVSRSSLEKFISPSMLWPWWDDAGFQNFNKENLSEIDRLCETKPKDDWLIHSGSLKKEYSPYSYRIPVIAKAASIYFGDQNDTLDDFIQKSQIVQAEAYKFIIERRRMRKHDEGGVLWWNLIDGWPQISEAVVDYYYKRKLAFYYIRQSQKDITVVMDSESGDFHDIYIVNDSQKEISLTVMVRDLKRNETKLQGNFKALANETRKIGSIPVSEEFVFYEIIWSGTDSGYNHFARLNKNTEKSDYIRCLVRSLYKEDAINCFEL